MTSFCRPEPNKFIASMNLTRETWLTWPDWGIQKLIHILIRQSTLLPSISQLYTITRTTKKIIQKAPQKAKKTALNANLSSCSSEFRRFTFRNQWEVNQNYKVQTLCIKSDALVTSTVKCQKIIICLKQYRWTIQFTPVVVPSVLGLF